MHRIAAAFLCFVFITSTNLLAQQESVDLLASVDPSKSTLRGQWTRTDDGISVDASRIAICVVPYEVTGAYELAFEFTRTSGEDTVGMILPLGRTQVALEFGAWTGGAHGFSRVNKSPVKDEANPASVRPGVLENDRRYRVVVNVRPDGDTIKLNLKLDDRQLVDWSGTFADVEPNKFVNIRKNNRFALFTNQSQATFHSLRVSHAPDSGKRVEVNIAAANRANMPAPAASAAGGISAAFANASIKTVPSEASDIDLTDVAWKDVDNCRLDITQFGGESVVTLRGANAGNDGAVALLPGSMLGDGEIEVDIASDIFSGIAFRAADVDNFEVLYFRPQNAGTAKHQNTVQYASKGIDGGDWRSLRENFPGKYETGVDIKKNEWFHVRLVLKGESLSVFVNDGSDPVLIVDKMLGSRANGAFGIWGWNTRYRNFSFKPST